MGEMVEAAAQVVAAFGDGVAAQLREAVEDNPRGHPTGVGVDRRHSAKPKRCGPVHKNLSGEQRLMSTCVSSPLSNCATKRPVAGAKVMPSIACPAA